MTSPAVAIGVLAHDEERSIERMLASVLRQSLWQRLAADRRQIVVYANGCSDRTAEVAERFGVRNRIPELEVVETGVKGKSLGWNVLRRHLRADAEWWIFADADVILHFRALERMFEAASAHPEAAVISSTLVSSARFVPPGRRGPLIAARVETERWKTQRREVSARLYAIRREVAGSIELPAGLLNEDLWLTRRLGAEAIVRCADAFVFNREPQTVRDLVRYQLRTRVGSFQARSVRGQRLDSNKSLASIRRRTALNRRLSWRAWLGKAAWIPLRVWVEWRARRIRPNALGQAFWMDIPSSKLGARGREPT